MKKILIPVIAVACASIAAVCSACQNSSESNSDMQTSAPVIATADESTKDESATLPKITEPSATIPSSTSEVPTEPEQTEDGTVATYPNGTECLLLPCPTIQPLSADNDQNEKTSNNRVGSCFSSDRRGFVDSSEDFQSNRQTGSADSD